MIIFFNPFSVEPRNTSNPLEIHYFFQNSMENNGFTVLLIAIMAKNATNRVSEIFINYSEISL